MKKLIGTTTAFAVALWASAALAGVYVSGPLPSEFSGGTIGPNPDSYAEAWTRKTRSGYLEKHRIRA